MLVPQKINLSWVARIFQNRVVLYLILLFTELQFFTINWLNSQLRHPTDGWELKIGLIDNHLGPHPLWLIPYWIGFSFTALIPLWGMYNMPTKIFRQFVLAMLTAALVSYTIYIFVPTYVTKPASQAVPGHDMFSEMLRETYKADAAASTHNAAPSQHVFYAVINMCFMIRFRPRRRVFWTWVTLGTLVTASTLLTRRHNSPDLIAGFVVAVFAYYVGVWLGARITAWLDDEDSPIVLPDALTRYIPRHLRHRLRRRLARRAGAGML